MSKRRPLPSSDGDEDDSGRQGRRGRAARADRLRAARSKKPKDSPLWRRAIIPGGIAAAIIVVLVLVIYGTGLFFQPPCIQLQAIPAGSGTPLFPAENTTDFSSTWCPSDTAVLVAYPSVTVSINGQTLPLPPSIGRNSNFTDYTCILPIETQAASAGLGSNVVTISSPWPYVYTLGDFFVVWQASYSQERVNSTYSTTTIDYTSSELLGLPINGGHSVTLFVDNQPSADGPNLDLDTLSSLSTVYPSCLGTVYGTGHSVLIQYKAAGAAAIAGPGIRGPTLSTAASGGALADLEYGSPLPRATSDSTAATALAKVRGADLAWLALRWTA